MMNELSVTDLCGFVCEYLASTSVRIVWNKSRNQMGVHRYGCADECLDMASCRMLPDKGHSETADFQLLSPPPTNQQYIFELQWWSGGWRGGDAYEYGLFIYFRSVWFMI